MYTVIFAFPLTFLEELPNLVELVVDVDSAITIITIGRNREISRGEVSKIIIQSSSEVEVLKVIGV